MLVAHHIVDILKDAIVHGESKSMTHVPGITKGDCHRAITGIEEAEKFDFGTLPFELIAEKDPALIAIHGEALAGVWNLPALTDEEKEFWVESLIPLPAPVCWFEFTIGNSRSGLLVHETDDQFWTVERVDYTLPQIVFDGIVVRASKVETKHSGGKLNMVAGGNNEFLRLVQSNSRFMDNNVGANLPLAIYLTLMLNSKTSEVRREPAPERLNKKRARSGKTPLSEHRIVVIVPEKFRRKAEDEAKGTHRPPRLHWRRSHLRHYDHHVPSARWRPDLWHEGKQGWWVSVIARQIVGRADLGEVSHEYRIGGQASRNTLQSHPSGTGTALSEEIR